MLPTSRDITLAASAQAPSSLLNRLQDFIIDHESRIGPAYRFYDDFDSTFGTAVYLGAAGPFGGWRWEPDTSYVYVYSTFGGVGTDEYGSFSFVQPGTGGLPQGTLTRGA